MRKVAIVSICLFFAMLSLAQFRRGWTTYGGDPQRTGWNKTENELNLENVRNLKLEWSLKLNNASKELNSLTVPLVTGVLITPRGFKELVIVAGASDKVFAIDTDTGKLYWEKTMSVAAQPQGGRPAHWLCPNALNADPVIAPLPQMPGESPGPGGGRFRGQGVYVIASDGKLHGFNLISGEDVIPPVQFVPPLSKNWALNAEGSRLYTVTSQGCGGAHSGVWSLDLNDPQHKVANFLVGSTRPGGAGIWGRGGAALTSEGNIIVETGDGAYDPAKGDYADSVIELSKDLKLLDYYTPSNRGWITRKDLDMGNLTPVVFKYKSWELVAAAGKEGVLYLLDAKSLGGPNHRTPLFRSPLLTNEEVNFAGRGFWGSLSTWEDESGARWLYAPAWGPPTPNTKFPTSYGPTPNGSVMAFKVETQNDKPVLVPTWNSVDMSLPTPVVIANGVVYAISDGDNPAQSGPNGGVLNTAERIKNVGHAVLYALDAKTGKVLYSSGDTIKTFSHFNAPVVASGRVYATTHDSTLYAFSLGNPAER